METVSLGLSGVNSVTFYDAASEEDDLGGGRIYAALVKYAILKRTGKIDQTVERLTQGNADPVSLLDGSTGAIIADTSDKSNIPMQIICPVGFDSRLATEIYNQTGKTVPNCYVEEFLYYFQRICNRYSISAWTTFVNWFNSYRTYLNASIQEASLRIQVYDGATYNGFVYDIPELNHLSDLFGWILNCVPLDLMARPTNDIIADNNPEKIGFTMKFSNMHGPYESYLGLTSATLHFIIRL